MNNKPQSPVNEFLAKIRKKLNSNPLSLSAMAYREILNEGPEMAANEAELIRQAFLEGYKQAFNDIKEHNETKGNEPTIDARIEGAQDRMAINTTPKQKRGRPRINEAEKVKKGNGISKNPNI
jgi:hypothetical protein